MDTQVLIVGAGPTGLMLANQLSRRGVRVMIVDRHTGPAQQTRAMAVHARSLEIYAQLGLAEQALALGRRGNAANLWAEGSRKARIPVGDIGKDLSPYPFVLMLGQDDNERLLGDALRKRGVAVQWNTELVALEQRSDQAIATLKLPDGHKRIISAAYVAGCDGGRSSVRELSGIGFPGAPYEHVFFVADTEATGSMVPEELNVYLWRDGFHLFFPMRGPNRWRVIGILPKHLRDKAEPTFEEAVPAVQREAGANLSFQSCSWFSTYRIYHRCAERFRDRRSFLLGDAAHVHSPMGGQGMNTGLQDAYNLAWKLTLVLSNEADPALLDTYEAERLPVARRLLRTTDRAFSLLVSDSRVAGLFRTRIFARIAAVAMTIARVRRLSFRTISQIGIRYPKSALSQTLPDLQHNAPRAGDRFPWSRLKFKSKGLVEDLFGRLDDTCFNLIAIGQSPSSEETFGLGDLLKVHSIPDDPHNVQALAFAGVPIPSFYLLRPDGHIGLAGGRLNPGDVAAYLKLNHLRTGNASERLTAGNRARPYALLVAVLAIALLVVGCGRKEEAKIESVRPVVSMTVGMADGSVGATYSGEIQARYQSKLGFRVSGKIVERFVEVGGHVSRGQVLMRLDPEQEVLRAEVDTAQLEAARSRAAQNRIDLERTERLFSKRFASQAELDQQRLALAQSEAQLKAALAQQQLALNQQSYTRLVADRSGVITAIHAEVGQVVSGGQPVLVLAGDGEREVVVSIPESRVAEIRSAKAMSVSLWARSGKSYRGKLRELAPDTDSVTRTYMARITVLDPDAELRLGMTASVFTPDVDAASAIRLPLTAIHNKDGQPLVWVVDRATSQVATRAVKLGTAQNDAVLITQGLSIGETVVTVGVHMLYAGQKVRIVDSADLLADGGGR